MARARVSRELTDDEIGMIGKSLGAEQVEIRMLACAAIFSADSLGQSPSRLPDPTRRVDAIEEALKLMSEQAISEPWAPRTAISGRMYEASPSLGWINTD